MKLDAVQRLAVLGAVAAVGLAAAAVTAFHVGYDVVDDDGWRALVRGGAVALYVGVGAYTWHRRPGSRLGLLVAALGFLYTVASLTPAVESGPHTLGRVAHAVFLVLLVYTFLCFPHDVIRRRVERLFITAFALSLAVLWAAALLVAEYLPPAGPILDCGDACPENALQVVSASAAVTKALEAALGIVSVAALVALLVLIARKARSPVRLQRRLVGPVLAGVVLLAVNYNAHIVLRVFEAEPVDGLRLVGALSGLALPVTMLLGQVRGRVFAATSIGELVFRVGSEQVTAGRVQVLLREALGDPQLVLAFPDGSGGWVGVDGRPVSEPVKGDGLALTPVARDGREVAALVHDGAVGDEPGVAQGLAATSLLLLENAQLVKELRASRERIVTSAQRERLRLERDLHDSAQQRLFAIQLKLASARARAGDERLEAALGELEADAAAAAEELRRVAHGLYPTVLRERGLRDAVRAAARGAGVPVHVEADGLGRVPAPVEEAVYFTVLEAIQNATKHAGRDAQVTVGFELSGDELEFTVKDDGLGFDPGRRGDGTGLANMRDRIDAIGGRIEVRSRPGRGSTVHGVVPGCAGGTSTSPEGGASSESSWL